MLAIQIRQLQKLPNSFLAIALCGFSILQGCGQVFPNETRTTNQQDQTISEESSASSTKPAFNEKMIEGTWTQPCIPGNKSRAEKLILKDGKFTREFVYYSNECQIKDEQFSYSGTYSLRTKASNVQELSYAKGNFELKPTSFQNVYEIDFTIDEWTIERKEKIKDEERAELNALSAECSALDVKITDSVLQVRRNGCELSKFTTHLFDIITIQGQQLRLGMYINDLNSFDSAGGTSPELRNNVISNLPLIHVN